MRRAPALRIAFIVVCAVSWMACERAAPAPPRPVINVGYAGEADFIDLPSLIAHERLRAHGYRIEATFFSASDVAIQAVSRGSVDVAHGSMISAWTAVSRGAHLRTVMDHVANPYRLISGPGVEKCSDVTGRRLGLPAESSVSAQLVHAYIDEECPSAKPDVLLLAESSSRAAAFLAGGVDAGALELSSWLWLQKRAPDRFRMLSDFSTRWPNIKTTGVHVNTDFAALHSEAVRDYLRALLDANRDVMANPDLLVSEANAKMGRTEDWAADARSYLEAGVWPQRGGFSRDDVEATLTFFKKFSHLDRQLTVDAVADVSFLEDVLAHWGE
jgi:ABC-type nitrate/sulfonate/bicarbonate transport system substrate-binding protein